MCVLALPEAAGVAEAVTEKVCLADDADCSSSEKMQQSLLQVRASSMATARSVEEFPLKADAIETAADRDPRPALVEENKNQKMWPF